VCDTVLDTPTAGPVCAACWRTIRPLTPPLCLVCGDPLPAGRLAAADLAPAGAADPPAGTRPAGPLHALRCPRCRRGSSLIARSRAVGEYSGTLRALVHLLKYDKRRSLAPHLAALMMAAGKDVLRGADAAIPVPLHWTRTWRRGFNQASLLAAGLGVPVWPALARVRATPAQVDLTAAARRLNVRNAFAVAPGRWPWQPRWRARLKGTIVVLVDDVSTTAATLDACAKPLREAGVREVRALTAARVVG
jgi:ComF family protein